jgi:RNA polymerase sigma-B factor
MYPSLLLLQDVRPEQLIRELRSHETSSSAKERILEHLTDLYMPLAKQAARRYQNSSESQEDLLQVACLGLLNAINRFDPSLGHAFKGYAFITMIGEIKHHFRDRTWAVQMPHLYQQRHLDLQHWTTELYQTLHRAPTIAELATHMRISREEVLLTLEASAAYRTDSLDVQAGDHDDCLGDRLAADGDCFGDLIDRQAVKSLVDRLPQRERKILLLRFYGDLSQSEIADELGISQMHVSRILRAVLAQLRCQLLD